MLLIAFSYEHRVGGYSVGRVWRRARCCPIVAASMLFNVVECCVELDHLGASVTLLIPTVLLLLVFSLSQHKYLLGTLYSGMRQYFLSGPTITRTL